MCHALLQDPSFFHILLRIDQELAAQARAGGCLFCGGVLHCANYPRKPRACLEQIRADFDSRYSFCCSRCRKRCTSMSVRFLGRRLYLALAVVIGSARHAKQIQVAPGLAETLMIPIRTLERWRQWWQVRLPQTPFWQAHCARFMPPLAVDQLPGELLTRFTGLAAEPMLRLLLFLTPLTVPSLIAFPKG